MVVAEAPTNPPSALSIPGALPVLPAATRQELLELDPLEAKVLPVGGIKEKVLAAHRSGIRTVILPRENERDLEDIPNHVREEMTFHFAVHCDEVLELALLDPVEAVAA